MNMDGKEYKKKIEKVVTLQRMKKIHEKGNK